MDSLDILGLLLIATLAWLWLDSLKSREIAVSEARTACNSEGLLLLDDTVAIQRLGMGRDGESGLRIRRVYSFEYSSTGNDRWTGNLVMLGDRVLVVNVTRPAAPEDLPGRLWLH
jgi:hypothetical protein